MVASAVKLAAQVVGRRPRGDEGFMYYLNEGCYGALNCTIFDHQVVRCEP